MKKLTMEWVRKAEADLRVVRKIYKATPLLRDETCFHCQQAAEKYLKAVLL
jgi:HEPN domain-containing protein